MKTIRFEWDEIEKMCMKIVTQMYTDHWYPDYIVGITRGGNIPATIISQLISVPCNSLKISLRCDPIEVETNSWMSEDALGHDRCSKKNILIIDDINDTGKTFSWLVNDWESSCIPTDPGWSTTWNHNVRFAALIENESSDFELVRYYSHLINKSVDPQWIEFPWENILKY